MLDFRTISIIPFSWKTKHVLSVDSLMALSAVLALIVLTDIEMISGANVIKQYCGKLPG
jgi:hypothetical protein